MCQREGQIAAPEEEHSVQEHQLPGASNLQNSAPMAGMQVPQMSGDFKRALDIVVPATLVIKWALAQISAHCGTQLYILLLGAFVQLPLPYV